MPFARKGMIMVPPAALKAAVTDFDARGLTVKMHAAGDGAVRAGLDAIEAARKANGFTGLFHNLSHNSFVQMSDFRRARALGATFEMSPYIWYPNPIIPDIAKAVGPERMKRWTPVKDAIDSGALVVPGSDWAVVPSVNPWIAIETLVTRQAPGGKGEALGAAEKITLEQAIRMFTINSARQMGNRNRTGSLERGLLADLVVLDRNPFRIPITQVHETRVKMTVINGEIVYEVETLKSARSGGSRSRSSDARAATEICASRQPHVLAQWRKAIDDFARAEMHDAGLPACVSFWRNSHSVKSSGEQGGY